MGTGSHCHLVYSQNNQIMTCRHVMQARQETHAVTAAAQEAAGKGQHAWNQSRRLRF